MRKLVICLCFVAAVDMTAQMNDVNAHKRYWYYRTRMINDFIKIGKEQGDCLVFAERNRKEDNLNAPNLESTIGPDQIDITNMYMMTLALEYKMLTRNNQDVSETIKELYHLLYTFNRLDLEAEQFRGPTYPNSQGIDDHVMQNGLLNGFALREDMPRAYVNEGDNLTHYNYELLENNYPNTPNAIDTYKGFTGVQHTNKKDGDSKFSYYYDNYLTNFDDMFLPQDKYQSLLVALMFIDKYIPANVTYKPNGFNFEVFQDNESSIRQEARNIANRCYNYLKGPNGYWDLKTINLNGTWGANIGVGNDAWIYSWPFSRMACKANRDFPWGLGSSNYACSGYNSSMATTVGYTSYNTLSAFPLTSATEDNSVFLDWSQAGCNSPASGFPISQQMWKNTSIHGTEWAELLRKVLHQDQTLYKQLGVYAIPLYSAPCQGPYNYGNCNNGGWEWSSQDRLEHPGSRGKGCPGYSNTDFQGNYPGVDYMLLHNLYYEYQNQIKDGQDGNVGGWLENTIATVQTAGYNASQYIPGSVYGNGGTGSNFDTPGYGYNQVFNYMDNFDTGFWPYRLNGITHGITTNPKKYSVFQNLKSTAKIRHKQSLYAPTNTTPSDVRYRAGKEIVLLPGFEVELGATFHGYIKRYVCNGNTDDMSNFKGIKDSTALANPYEMDYEMDDINLIPTHYIESPKSDADLNPVVSVESEDDILPTLPDNEYLTAQEFSILPNPNNGLFHIHTIKEFPEEKLSITIYDMRGQLIATYTNIEEDLKIDISQYSKGIYMVQLLSSTGKSLTKRVDVAE